MHNAPAVEAELVQHPLVRSDHGRALRLQIWQRLLIALALMIVEFVVGIGVWLVGMLMFTFTLDGASPGDLPDWLDAFMLIGWPLSIGLVVLLPPIVLAAGAHWKWVLGSLLLTGILSTTVYFIGVVTVFASLA